MSDSGHVTVVALEDDAAIRRLLQAAFQDGEFKLFEADAGESGIALIKAQKPAMILLDMMLPDISGMDVIREVRTWSQVPIIIISGRGDEQMKVDALHAGADDYVTKPFSISELKARMSVALRHSAAQAAVNPTSVIEHGDFRIDIAEREVHLAGKPVRLTPIEFKLLATLAKHAGKVVTQRQLLNDVWGPEYNEEAQYLRVYMGYLRKKLEPDATSPKLILTEHRVGYRLAI
jgi:two-component system KDP operon response regulator KdpE